MRTAHWLAIATLVVAFWALPATAADPECDPAAPEHRPYDPATGPYAAHDAGERKVVFCTPAEKVDDGGPVVSPMTCTVRVCAPDGTACELVASIAELEPSVRVEVPIPARLWDGRQLDVWCDDGACPDPADCMHALAQADMGPEPVPEPPVLFRWASPSE